MHILPDNLFLFSLPEPAILHGVPPVPDHLVPHRFIAGISAK